MSNEASLNVSLEQMQSGLEAYRQGGASDRELQLIEWAFHWCVNELGRDKMRLADELGYHDSNCWKLFMGRYTGNLANFCDAIEQARVRADMTVAVDMIETPVTVRIREALNYARNMNAMVVVRGQTGRSKSYTAKQWCRENNHGRTLYVECAENTTYTKLLGMIAGGLGASRSVNNSAGFREIIFRQASRRHTLVVDEAGHLYNGASTRNSTRCFDLLRDLYNRNHCGIVLIFTDYYWDMICRGKLHGYFEQFLGRISYNLAIPEDVIFADEIIAIIQAYCRKAGGSVDQEMIKQASEIASGDQGKLRTLFNDLDNAVHLASVNGQDFNGTHLRKARRWREAGGDWSNLQAV